MPGKLEFQDRCTGPSVPLETVRCTRKEGCYTESTKSSFERRSGVDDSTIVGKCQGGQSELYGQLVDKYSARIINLGYAMMGNRHDAEDIAQEAFVRAYKALAKFQKKAKFSSWLYQIALNLCKDHLKAKSRHARPADEEQLANINGNPKDQAPRVIIQGELSEKMREAINKLPYLYREAFVLRHLQGLEYEDVATITAVPADTVRVRAYRAREMMRQTLSPNVDTFWREKAAKEKGRGNRE